jgi:hypothetical protein
MGHALFRGHLFHLTLLYTAFQPLLSAHVMIFRKTERKMNMPLTPISPQMDKMPLKAKRHSDYLFEMIS